MQEKKKSERKKEKKRGDRTENSHEQFIEHFWCRKQNAHSKFRTVIKIERIVWKYRHFQWAEHRTSAWSLFNVRNLIASKRKSSFTSWIVRSNELARKSIEELPFYQPSTSQSEMGCHFFIRAIKFRIFYAKRSWEMEIMNMICLADIRVQCSATSHFVHFMNFYISNKNRIYI